MTALGMLEKKLIKLIKYNTVEIQAFAKLADVSDKDKAQKLIVAIDVEVKEIVARIDKYFKEELCLNGSKTCGKKSVN